MENHGVALAVFSDAVNMRNGVNGIVRGGVRIGGVGVKITDLTGLKNLRDIVLVVPHFFNEHIVAVVDLSVKVIFVESVYNKRRVADILYQGENMNLPPFSEVGDNLGIGGNDFVGGFLRIAEPVVVLILTGHLPVGGAFALRNGIFVL